jgi:hypothetical protein
MLKTGTLSADVICNAIWQEMSYNPKRFGSKSPFVHENKNSLCFFITKEIDSESKAFYILQKIQMYLSKFWTLAIEYDKSFAANEHFEKNYILIKNTAQKTANTKPVPCDAYKMLSYLRNCIHIIASQNIEDFKKRQYRELIINSVLGTYSCMAPNQKMSQINSENYLAEKQKIENEISEKTAEISVIQSRIDSLTNDFENSGDTTNEITKLQIQTAALKQLEIKLQSIIQYQQQYGN